MTRLQVRRDVSRYSVRIWEKGWVANHDGNVSQREGDGFFVTPTGVSKRDCTPESIVHCSLEGEPLSRGRPPSEVGLHVGTYRGREDARAVIHAHPPYASAFALARKALGTVNMPEVVVSLGDRIPLGPLVLPKQAHLAEEIEALMTSFDAVLLAGNGALTLGDSLEQAYLRMELVEHYAHIVWTASGPPGPPVPLSSDERAYLQSLRPPAARRRADLGAVPREDRVRAVVDREVRRRLEGRR